MSYVIMFKLFSKSLIPVLIGTAVLGAFYWLSSCGTRILHERITSGEIEYQISFPYYSQDGLMAGLLPDKTKLSFDEDHQASELSAGMGVFRTSLITYDERQEVDYHLSVLGKKMVSRLGIREVQAMLNADQHLTFIYSDQTDTIAGLPCKKAIALFDAIDQPEIILYYTDHIGIKNPNWYGPFKDIPGVLLRYEIVQYDMRMRLEAVAVKEFPVLASNFERRSDHEDVPPERIEHEIKEVLSGFTP